MIDYSFLRLRNDFDDAKDLGESPQVDSSLAEYSQVHLCPGETYFQISNSPTSISFNDNYEVYLVDICGNELEDVTERIYLTEWFDSNGIKQIRWEYVNGAEYYMKPLSLRFRNTVNDDTWWTNLFVSTEFESELTAKIIYKNFQDHYGTQYSRSDYYQCIRLSMYFRNKINESERQEYHEITTNRTVPQRNIKKFKERYLLSDFDTFTTERLEIASTSSEFYLDSTRAYSTTPIEFIEPELDSNFAENEAIFNKDYSQVFEYEYQIFEGFVLSNFMPFGLYATGYQIEAMSFDSNLDLTINTGTISVYSSDGTLIDSFDEGDMVLNGSTQLKIVTTGTPIEFLSNDTYYVHVSAGLVSGLGIPNTAINDTSTWAFTIRDADYDSDDYNSNDYFTD